MERAFLHRLTLTDIATRWTSACHCSTAQHQVVHALGAVIHDSHLVDAVADLRRSASSHCMAAGLSGTEDGK
jgi:hypothetical protein